MWAVRPLMFAATDAYSCAVIQTKYLFIYRPTKLNIYLFIDLLNQICIYILHY